MYFVYCDVDLITNLPIYYGSGTVDRICEDKRNKKHSFLSTRHKIKRSIVYVSDNRKECYDVEKLLIALNWDYFNTKGKFKGRAICNKIIDSNNKNEVENALAKGRELHQQKLENKKLYPLKDCPIKIVNNRKYYMVECVQTCERYITRSKSAIAIFLKLNPLEIKEFHANFFTWKGNKKKKIEFIIQGIKYSYTISIVRNILDYV